MTANKVQQLLSSAHMMTATADRGQAIGMSCTFTLDGIPTAVASAHLFATAHGIYEARLNGEPVSGAVLNPGWTSYEWRLAVQDIDVTSLVSMGGRSQTLDVVLGNGWWRGGLGFNQLDIDYGPELGFIATLLITYADASTQLVVTDPAFWHAYKTSVVENSLYDGETIDARVVAGEYPLELHTVEFDRTALMPQTMPAVERIEVLHPQRIWFSPTGKVLVDFGQNIAGWVRLRVQGPRGSEIVVRYAEVLEHGELGVRPLREAKATDTFILSGEQDVFEPTMTYHGFRYVEVTGWPGNLNKAELPNMLKDALEAVAISTKIDRTGWFECSDARINRLVQNSVWSQRDNFVSLPTDCPQRDERLGWTGDIAVFAPTAAFQFDCQNFLGSWLQDLIAEANHSSEGVVPLVVPDVLKLTSNAKKGAQEFALWGDAAVWVPWTLWQAYGDIDALEAQYPAMVLHLNKVEELLSPSGLWDTGFQLGDWLDPAAPPNKPNAGKTDPYLVAQACACYSARIASWVAEILDKKADSEHWYNLYKRLRKAFRHAYVQKDGSLTSNSVTAYALALHFDLLKKKQRARAAQHLAKLVRKANYTVTTGFAGTPYVTWALSENGYLKEAYKMLCQDKCPSWLYPVSMGATTVWERWDSMLPSGTINPGGMTSFNHYALGAVCDWIYQVIGGIRPDAPGYTRVRIEPKPGADILWTRCAYDSAQGRIAVFWERHQDGFFELEVTVPAGIPACVKLPCGTSYEVVGGTHRFGCELSS